MDNTTYVALSRQMTLRRELDIIANNVANADTAGFKVEQLLTEEEPLRPAKTFGVKPPVDFVIDGEVARDFTQGALQQTGNTFDLAVEGDGFLVVRTAAGDRYTRDGRLQLDSRNRLVTHDGDPVLAGGGEVAFDPQGPTPTIAPDGTISQGEVALGKLDLVRFDERRGLAKAGDNLFAPPEGVAARPAPDVRVRQGMVEQSNVKPVLEITNLIEVSRAYERATRIVDGTSDLSRRSIERLGRSQ
jgi:flagellar basal-body rod protein FlgF